MKEDNIFIPKSYQIKRLLWWWAVEWVHINKPPNPRQWFKWVKGIGNSDQIYERLEVESIKHLSDIEQAELIADKFANVSNEYQPLDTI